jgi:hypothetical protein
VEFRHDFHSLRNSVDKAPPHSKNSSIHRSFFCDGRLSSFHRTRKANVLLKRADGVLGLLARERVSSPKGEGQFGTVTVDRLQVGICQARPM